VANAVNLWGPALLVYLTVILGFLWTNSGFNDMRSSMSDLRSYIDARFNAQDKRMDDLRDFVKSEVRRIEERISPIYPGR
jgi:hypothetical protein